MDTGLGKTATFTSIKRKSRILVLAHREELKDSCYDEENMRNEEKEYYNNLTRTKINELIKAIKQIDKK